MEPSAIDMTIGALQRFLDAVEPERGATVTAVVPLSGGYSRDTAIADVIWGDGASERFVLRADPPAGTGVFLSDRDPEWRLLRVLQNTGPVRIPKSRWYDAEGQYFGTKCIVSSFYESRALQEIALSPVELTRREQEIVAARGQSNAQIAERLVLSVRTVESHLYHAMAKLGVASRQELPSWVNRAAP